MKRKGKSERSKLVAKLDRAFSIYIRTRDRYRCMMCGSTQRVQCGHLFSRVAFSTRWNPSNAIAQCASCNLRNEYQPEHMTAWYLHRYGQEAWDLLYIQRNAVVKFGNAELRHMTEIFEQQTEKLLRERKDEA